MKPALWWNRTSKLEMSRQDDLNDDYCGFGSKVQGLRPLKSVYAMITGIILHVQSSVTVPVD